MNQGTTEDRRKSIVPTIITTSIGFVVVQLDVTIVNVALSQIGTDIGGSVSQLQWLVDAYTLPFAALLMGAGSFADLLGARRVHLVGLTIFSIASLACALAPSASFLICARALQGAAAAMILPTSLALLSRACETDESLRLRAIGTWTAIGGAVSAAGPILGGALTGWFGWWSIFLVNLPICLTSLTLTILVVPEVVPNHETKHDWLGQIIIAFSLFLLTYSFIEANSYEWTSPIVASCLTGSIALMMIFVIHENSTERPMVPMYLFLNWRFNAAILLGLITNLTFYGLIFSLGLFLQRIKHYTPLETGFALLPLASIMLGNMASARLTQRYSVRTIVIFGALMTIVSFGLLAGLSETTSYIIIVASLTLLALGSGISTPALTGVVLKHADVSLSSTASAIFGASRQIGGALGVALFGTLLVGSVEEVRSGVEILVLGTIATRLVGIVLAVLFL